VNGCPYKEAGLSRFSDALALSSPSPRSTCVIVQAGGFIAK
jgi:hypothetical protein